LKGLLVPEQLSKAAVDKIISGVVKALRPMVPAPREYYSPLQVAKQLGIEPAKTVGWIKRGELCAVNVADKNGKRPRWRVASGALDDFLKPRTVRPPVKTSRRKRPTDFETFFAPSSAPHAAYLFRPLPANVRIRRKIRMRRLTLLVTLAGVARLNRHDVAPVNFIGCRWGRGIPYG
jgi:hypothetical protein